MRSLLREVIAFPKTQTATCPLTDAPGMIDGKALQDLSLKTTVDRSKD